MEEVQRVEGQTTGRSNLIEANETLSLVVKFVVEAGDIFEGHGGLISSLTCLCEP